MTVHFADNPLCIVRDAFRALYPKHRARIVFQWSNGRLGQTNFAPGRIPLVTIDPTQSFVGCVDVLAHELAHVATEGAGHGKEWRKAYNRIRAEYLRIVRGRARGRVESHAVPEARVRNQKAVRK